MPKNNIEKLVTDNIIFQGVLGSHAYGINIEGSDEDIGGVALIPDKDYYIGNKSFGQLDSFKDENGNKIDKVIYNFEKIIKLASDCNPNIMDYLFLPDKCIQICKPEWQRVLENRDMFISKKARFTFSGYAYSQLSRIKNHRNYLLNPPKKKPERIDFKLSEKSIFPETQYEAIVNISTDFVEPELRDDFYIECTSMVDEQMYGIFNRYIKDTLVPVALQRFKVGQKHFLTMLSSIQSMYLKDEYTVMASNELAYSVAKKYWDKYQDWKKNRNPARQKLEAKCGFDAKHAGHLIRIMRMGLEILEGKGILVDRTNIDRDELLDIRLGNVPFDNVIEMYDKYEEKMKTIYNDSPIPKAVDLEKINQLKMDIIEKRVWKK